MTIAAHHAADWGTTKLSSDVRARDTSIDTMRGIAILMVIGIHSLPQPLSAPWQILLDSALRPCVPIFLFVSGAMSAGKDSIPLLRRLTTALVPYTLAFAAAYFYMALHNPHMDHRPIVTVARFCLAYVFVYYYVFVYIGCTVCLWLLLRLAKPSENGDAPLTLLLMASICFGLLVGAYIDPTMIKSGITSSLIEEVRMRDIPFWFSFVALGLLVGTLFNRPSLAEMKGPFLLASLLTYAVYGAARVWNIGDDSDYDSIAFFSYASSLTLLLFATGMSSQLLARLGSGSYFIYLWHIFIIMLLRDHGSFQQIPPIAEFAMTFIATVTSTVFVLFVVRRLVPSRFTHWIGA